MIVLLNLETNGSVILCAGVEHNPNVFVVGVCGDHSALACGNDHAGRRILQDVRVAECLIRAVIGGAVGEEVGYLTAYRGSKGDLAGQSEVDKDMSGVQ